VEDDAGIRDNLVALLNGSSGCRCVGACASGEEALVAGYFFKEIAGQLGISGETVRTHVNHIYRKLHVRSRTEAVVKYLRQGK
jgi:DNA-binding NarL/FixJ family response regulator